MKFELTKRQRESQKEKLNSAIELIKVAIMECDTATAREIAGTVSSVEDILREVRYFLKTRY